jgi:hypothetical protein
MRKQALKLVQQEFNRLLLNRCDMFVQEGTFKGSPGADLYVWRCSSDLNSYIHLLPNPKSYRDSFMVELRWSSGDYPVQASLQNKQRLNTQTDGRIRLPAFWREQWGSVFEPWWELGDPLTADNEQEFYSEEGTSQKVAAAPKAVMDAVNKIEKYAIPFFESIAPGRGVASASLKPSS